MDKIICVGKNYLDHAKELGDAVPEKPVLFLKPPSTLVLASSAANSSVTLPKARGPVHPECEIVVRLDAKGKINAVTLGLDMTLRDAQGDLKKKGHPWEIAKVFAHSSVLGPWIEIAKFQDYLNTPFTFSVNGTVRQSAKGSDMRYSPEQCLSLARDYFPICDGDIVFTGTPAGVNGVEPGQTGELNWGDQLSYKVRFV